MPHRNTRHGRQHNTVSLHPSSTLMVSEHDDRIDLLVDKRANEFDHSGMGHHPPLIIARVMWRVRTVTSTRVVQRTRYKYRDEWN
jgi:hypothetical protein